MTRHNSPYPLIFRHLDLVPRDAIPGAVPVVSSAALARRTAQLATGVGGQPTQPGPS